MSQEIACKARVEVAVKHARHVLEAVNPDNLVAPKHVRVSCDLAGDERIRCVIEVGGCPDNAERLLTLRNTIDDLINHMIVAAKTLETA